MCMQRLSTYIRRYDVVSDVTRLVPLTCLRSQVVIFGHRPKAVLVLLFMFHVCLHSAILSVH